MSLIEGISGIPNLEEAHCPECDESATGAFDLKDITTAEDLEIGQVRFAFRCYGCGFATSFVAMPGGHAKIIAAIACTGRYVVGAAPHICQPTLPPTRSQVAWSHTLTTN